MCVEAAKDCGLTRKQARDIIDRQVSTIRDSWDEVAESALMTTLEKDGLFGRQILNSYASWGYEPRIHQVPATPPVLGDDGQDADQ